jgi:hypothetical protein
MLDGWALVSVRVARRPESVPGGVVEFVVLVFSVVRHVDIDLSRHARTEDGEIGAHCARRSAKEGASGVPYLALGG